MSEPVGTMRSTGSSGHEVAIVLRSSHVAFTG
jgi:hypothetical protein